MADDYKDDKTEFVPVKLSNGATIKVEVSQTGREEVAFGILSFQTVSEAIEGIVDNLKESLEKVKPDKASVKLGLELSVETNALTAMLVKGSGKGNLEITLEWGR